VDLGKEVVLIDERDRLSGTSLIEGCIPSKVLINAIDVAQTLKNAEAFGLAFSDLKFDLDKLCGRKDSVVEKLTSGVNFLLKKRGIEIIKGWFDTGIIKNRGLFFLSAIAFSGFYSSKTRRSGTTTTIPDSVT
jgi:pyruvate/2-oxoglutarate dehydrogenase complex dihydrolipoamide dehydrogenase (E3) component